MHYHVLRADAGAGADGADERDSGVIEIWRASPDEEE